MNWIWAYKLSRTTPQNAMVHQGKMIVNSKRRTTIEAAGDHRDAMNPKIGIIDIPQPTGSTPIDDQNPTPAYWQV
jgi:hypothetical protein